ncbi:MAG: DNA polymerase III subunit epsilon [Gemmobacter sp.]
MREVVLDTETTGLDPAEGHRVVEIGAVELWNHLPTGRTFHRYLNPERPMPPEAQAVHGLDDAFLRDKPLFHQIADDLIAFLGDAPMIAHNAGFDARFLNAEFRRIDLPPLDPARIIDTRAMAMARFPGAPSSLDALCRRFGVDNSARTKHGALLDSEILAEVYLELVGGRQPGFGLAPAQDRARRPGAAPQTPRTRPRPLAPRITPAEAEAHAAFVAAMGPGALWLRD